MSLNPNAKSFSFSPSAASFTPSTPAPAAAPAEEKPADATPAPVEPVAAAPAPVAVEATPEPEAAPEPKPEPVVEEKETERSQSGRDSSSIRKSSKNESENTKAEAHHNALVEELKLHDPREHMNVVFIGHVDAGKSTVSGQILLQTGQVDERTIAKYEKEAKEKNRDSWYLAFIMDTNEEERAKGKTVEVGRAHFETDNKRYTLLDAPGHKRYVPNMISGAAQADVGILIISARRGEFETGFDRGGQTREHALLAKTLGITRIIVAINKMDESTVKWSEERFNKIQSKLAPFLRKCGYKKEEVSYIPISGYTGENLKDPVSEAVCPWYKERLSLLQVLNELPPLPRDANAPVRVPVIGRYKDMGVLTVLGKVESGTLCVGDKLVVEPGDKRCEVVGIDVNEEEVQKVAPGENVCIKVKGVEEEEVRDGFVLGSVYSPPSTASTLVVKLQILPLLEHKPIISSGYGAMLHIHTLIEECLISELLIQMDKKTGKAGKRRPGFVKAGDVVLAKITIEQSIAVEIFQNNPQLGRFTLRDEGLTIALGKIVKLE